MARSSSRQIHGGTQLLSLRLAEQLGDAVRLDAAVDVIDYSGELVRIQYRDTLISAQKVIIAMMPLDADRIMFLPALPRQRAALQRAWMASPAMVVNVSYETPFWREQGLSGIAYSDSEYLAITFDQSPPDGSADMGSSSQSYCLKSRAFLACSPRNFVRERIVPASLSS